MPPGNLPGPTLNSAGNLPKSLASNRSLRKRPGAGLTSTDHVRPETIGDLSYGVSAGLYGLSPVRSSPPPSPTALTGRIRAKTTRLCSIRPGSFNRRSLSRRTASTRITTMTGFSASASLIFFAAQNCSRGKPFVQYQPPPKAARNRLNCVPHPN